MEMILGKCLSNIILLVVAFVSRTRLHSTYLEDDWLTLHVLMHTIYCISVNCPKCSGRRLTLSNSWTAAYFFVFYELYEYFCVRATSSDHFFLYFHSSSIEPVAVTAKLIKSNIVVDSILLGNVQNDMLHGISNATGMTSSLITISYTMQLHKSNNAIINLTYLFRHLLSAALSYCFEVVALSTHKQPKRG